jgi:hypothetical protein
MGFCRIRKMYFYERRQSRNRSACLVLKFAKFRAVGPGCAFVEKYEKANQSNS